MILQKWELQLGIDAAVSSSSVTAGPAAMVPRARRFVTRLMPLDPQIIAILAPPDPCTYISC